MGINELKLLIKDYDELSVCLTSVTSWQIATEYRDWLEVVLGCYSNNRKTSTFSN